jgi:hypothetical protein
VRRWKVIRAMAIELWNDKTGNAIDDFDTEDEALAFVRETISLRGKRAVATWALDVSGDAPMIRGKELVRRALAIPA